MSGRIISGAHAEVSISGTPIAHIPLNGRPEFAGLAVDDDTAPIMTVEDGALVLTTDDRNVAVRHRDAWQQAINDYDARAKADQLRATRDLQVCGQRGCAQEIHHDSQLGQWVHTRSGEAACWPDHPDSTFADPCSNEAPGGGDRHV